MKNKSVILYNPSIGSMNEGDHIIYNSASKYVKSIFSESRFVELPTQSVVSTKVLKWFNTDVDFKFVCGTNLLKYGMLIDKKRGFYRFRNVKQWEIPFWNSSLVGPCILLGCGWHHYQEHADVYSNILWNRILDHSYMHSVRDMYTKMRLADIGIENVIVTGCPTLWDLTTDFCAEIPTEKCDKVVTTLTNYNTDVVRDQIMLDLLSENYSLVKIWLQGHQDLHYIKKMSLRHNVKILFGGLDTFDKAMMDDSTEYVGTRLHGGIRALQLKRRSTIISIDNRAIEMGSDFNLNVFPRNEIKQISEYLSQRIVTDIKLPQKEIFEFSNQFR